MSSSSTSNSNVARGLETEPTTSPMRLLKLQVWSLVLLLFLNILGKAYLDKNPVLIPFLIKEKWNHLLGQEEQADILVLGDSSGAFAIDPDLLQEEIGKRVQNFCTVGRLTVVDALWAYNSYVERVGPPRVVILCIYITTWEAPAPPPDLLSAYPLPWKFWETQTPALKLPLRAQSVVLANRYFPLFVDASSGAIGVITRPWHQRIIADSLTPTGGLVLSSFNPEGFQGEGRVLKERFDKTLEPFAISAFNQSLLDSLAEACLKNGTTLIVLNGPIYEGSASHPRYPEILGQLKEETNKFVDSYPNALIFFREPKLVSRDELLDSIHVKPSTAKAFTYEVLQMLKRASDGKDPER